MSKYSERRKKFRQRAEQGVKDREKGFAQFSVLRIKEMNEEYNIPGFKPSTDKKTRNLIDIIPFFVTQDWMIKARNFNGATLGVKPGDMLYKLEVPVHYNVGAEERAFVCRKFFLGKACAVCNDRESLKENDNAEEELIKSLYPKWKVFYNLKDKNEEEKEKRRKSWETSYHSFEKLFMEEADMGDDGVIIFADPEDGKTIKFKGRQKKWKTKKFVEADSIEFLDRKKQYTENDIKKSIPFDKYLIVPSYEEVEKAYLGIEDEEGGKKKKKKDK